MKKYLYLIGSVSTVLFGTSCKKDFTCECVTTSWDSSSGITTTGQPSEFTIKEAKKKTAKDVCTSTKYEGSFQSYSGTVQYTSDTDCVLK